MGLFPKERQWVEQHLPAPPSRVLVTGAGSGREVIALQEMGYAVDASEPSASVRDVLQMHCLGSTWQLSNQDLGCVHGPRLAARYDAILVGWTSLSYLLTTDEQLDFLRCCDELCPEGPILASYFARQGGLGAPGRLGARLARWFGAQGHEPPPGLGYLDRAGYLYGFERREIVALGDSIGRESVLQLLDGQHVTWRQPAVQPSSR